MFFFFFLNGLLVIRQIDNTSPGDATGGKLVPSSHKRCKLGQTVIRHSAEEIDISTAQLPRLSVRVYGGIER